MVTVYFLNEINETGLVALPESAGCHPISVLLFPTVKDFLAGRKATLNKYYSTKPPSLAGRATQLSPAEQDA